jgi:succinate dehydrogenase / fumarate reductase, cytochrome b subunit
MNWKDYFTSSIGKKLLVGATGLFLIIFLVVHCYVNAMIFWMDGGKHFTDAAAFMGGNVAVRIVEVGLFAALLLHMIQGLMLARQNMKRRSVGYAVNAGNKTSAWYSRSMGLLGTLILLFLVIHLANFWAPNRYGQFMDPNWKDTDLYNKMLNLFHGPNPATQIWVIAVYTLGCISLAWHLMHGFYSAFQTFGLATYRYKGCIRALGVAFSIIIPLLFLSMPLAMHLGWVN